MAVSLDQQATLKHLVMAGNNTVYAEGSVAGTLTEVSGITVDTTDHLNMFSGLQKAFVVNGTNLKIVDFANTKLTVAALTTPPNRGSILTQDTSGAQMVVDFVNTAKTAIYGYTTTTAAFNATNTISDGDGNMDPATPTPSAVAEASTAPLGYDWTVYPDGSSGSLPAKAYLGCWYRGRAVISGNPNDPHQWYMSRQLNPFDFAYVSGDAQSAVAGTNADAGKIGDIVRALIPFHDDYLIFGCAASLYYLQGDPASGGALHSLNDYVGIFGAQSWCFDDEGNLYFFASDGVDVLRRGSLQVENLSALNIPKLLDDEAPDPTTHRIVLGYDKRRHGVVIAITTLADGTNSNYFYDIRSGGFFPETYPEECGVYSMIYYPANAEANADLLLGCKDGYVRKFDDDAKDDDIGLTDEAVSSYVLMPIQDMSADDEDGQGRLQSTTFVNAGGAANGTFDDTDKIDYEIHVSNDAETLTEDVRDGATALHSGTLSGTGRQNRVRTKARGKYLGILLKNATAASTWALGKLAVKFKTAGRVK
jgi:hypothetical protein